MLLIWLGVGIVSAEASYGIIPLIVLALRRKGRYAEILLGFLFILIISDSRQYSLSFAVSLKNVYIVLMALILYIDRSKFQPMSNLIKGFVPFFVISTIALIQAPGDELFISVQKMLSYILLLLVVPNFLLLSYRLQGESFLRNLVWLGTLILFLGIVFRILNFDFIIVKGRFAGVFGNPNGLGIFCLLFWMLAAVIHNRFTNLFSRQEIYFIFGVIGAALILSGSRSSLVGLIIFLVFGRLYKLSNVFGFLSLVILIVSYEFLTLNINSIIISLGLEQYFRLETLETGSGRLVAWDFAWDNIQNHFFLGRGFAHTENLYIKYSEMLRALGHEGHAHNVYLTFWLNSGLIGLFCFFILGLIPLFLGAARQSNLAMPLLLGAMFSMNFESWLTASLNPFTILLWCSLTLLTNPHFVEASERWRSNNNPSEEAEDTLPDVNPKPLPTG
ncbi:MAG: O-antigen ligase family protein [Salibacteraceae bacterium]